MSFLQPWLLAGLPLVGLPIVIHLINRQRYRTIPWAAMMFLFDAQRTTRGMAQLRYWLIMVMRMLAIAGLMIAVARPLAGGWLGWAVSGRPDTTILLLDRSASMEQQDLQSGQSKRSTGLQKLSALLRTQAGTTHAVLIENTENDAQAVGSVDSLLELPQTAATATSADIPAMLRTAMDYLVANRAGRADIWICSDLRDNDWAPRDARWSEIRDGFRRLEGVRFYLLSYREPARDNVSVMVRNVQRRTVATHAELVLDVALRRESDGRRSGETPVQFVINGARSALKVDMTEDEFVLQGHTMALDGAATAGWGRVELPADANPQDNVGYFVFGDPPEHRAVIVSDDPRVAELLRLVVVSPADPGLSYSATQLTSDRAHEMDWNAASLILWHAQLPDGIVAQQLRDFAGSGRPVICFPPAQPNANGLLGVQWQPWRQAAGEQPLSVASWRGDSDLLCHTRSGGPLPVGKLRTYRYCPIEGGGHPLARLGDGTPLLTRAAVDQAPVYFCATTPRAEDSSLAQDGVVFYVMVQRALSVGAATQGKARQCTAGTPEARQVVAAQTLSDAPAGAPSRARPFQAGAYQDGERLIALNRPAGEDGASVLDDAAVGQLFAGLDYRQVEDRIGSTADLVSEIWKAFLLVMSAALLLEAWLCLPERRRRQGEVLV